MRGPTERRTVARMSAYFTSIKQAGGGATAYARYVAAPLAADTSAVDTDITAGDTEAYATYVAEGAEPGEGVGRWLGVQAAEWGLSGQPVTVETLRTVLEHRDPVTGQDLDEGRVRRAERHGEKRERWERARVRWAAKPALYEAAAGFDRLVEAAVAGGGTVDPAMIAEHLGGHLTPEQATRVARSVAEAAARGRSQVAAVRAQQARQRFVPPADRMARTPPADPSREVIGYDLTLSAPKSVSLLMADPTLREDVVACHDRAVASTAALLERELTAIRAGAGGTDRSGAVGLAAAAVNHYTSRPAGDPPIADPSLHTHLVISALVQGRDGQWSGVDSRTWMRAKSVVSAHFAAELRAELTAELGVEWRQRTTRDPISGRAGSSWELALTGEAARDDGLIDSFSRRTAEIRAEVEATRAAGEKVSKDVAWRKTRADKGEAQLSECEHQWAARLSELGVTPAELTASACDRVARDVREAARASRTHSAREVIEHLEGKLESLDGADQLGFVVDYLGLIQGQAEQLAAERGAFSRVELVRAVAGAVVDPEVAAAMSGDELMARVDTWLLNVGVPVQLPSAVTDPTRWIEARWSTDAHLAMELQTLATVDRLSAPAKPAVSQTIADEVMTMYRAAKGGAKGALTEEQAKLFVQAVRSRTRLTACVAPAGAGKSYVAAAIVEAWRREHGPAATVHTVALASVAGDALSHDLLGEKADLAGSIDRLLFQLDHKPAEGKKRPALDKRTLVVIDEAGMAGTEKLGEILRRIDKAGARVLLFGDPAQLDPPAQSGGLLRYLTDHRPETVVQFNTTSRAKDEAVREQQIKWRSALGRNDTETAAETLHWYADRGAIEVADGEVAARDAVFNRWRMLYEEGKERAAAWESARDVLEAAVETAPNRADRKGAKAALAAHVDTRDQQVADDLLLMASTHEDVAALNDTIRDYLIERGDLCDKVTVEGRRWRSPGQPDAELLTAADGADISDVVYMKGMTVRVTVNTNSGHIKEHIDDLKEEIGALKEDLSKHQGGVRGGDPQGRHSDGDVVTYSERKADAAAARDLRASTAAELSAVVAEAKESGSLRDEATQERVAELRVVVAEQRERAAELADLSSTERMVRGEAMGEAAQEMKKAIALIERSRILNGQRGTVEQVHPEDGGMTIRVPNGADGTKLVRLSAEQLEKGEVVPGMAITVHAAEGASVDRTVALADENSNGNSNYVAMTRARYEAYMVFRGDLDLVDPREVQRENNARRDRLENTQTVEPDLSALDDEVDEVPGLWQVERAWCTPASSQMAVHVAADAGIDVTDTDRAFARSVLVAIGGDVNNEALVEEKAAERAADRLRQAATHAARPQDRQRDRGRSLSLSLS